MNVCKDDASILIIYTGGTIGMIENPETGSLEAFNFEHLEEHVPELKNLLFNLIHRWIHRRWDRIHG